MEEIKTILRQKNLKASSARLLLLEKLFPEQTHFTAEELFHTLKNSLPGLSLGTVYKNLEDLQAAGILRMVTLPNQVRQFEWERGDHIHLVEGNQVSDLEDPNLFSRIRAVLEENLGGTFDITSVDIHVFGTKKYHENTRHRPG